jgi:NADPH-dependent stearoyl-CoA 9-desaturase
MNTPLPDAASLKSFEKELDALRLKTLAQVGEQDAKYIKRIVAVQRTLEIAGRACLQFSFILPLWFLGTLLLALSKILDNMEIGHNVMHGQYDWMNHPVLHSSRFEWDNVCAGPLWKKTHNYEHHTYTNIIGKDRDYGYDALRMDKDGPWSVKDLLNLPKFLIISLIFQWSVGFYGIESSRAKDGTLDKAARKKAVRTLLKKAFQLSFKDYLFFPALGWLTGATLGVLTGNLVANMIRNLWASSVIFCGHFPEGVHTFTEEECLQESKGQWYFRQISGSCNFNGSHFLHVMSGHLSTQIEHHLFPDIPSSRYESLIPEVKAICARHGIAYNTASFGSQYLSVVSKIFRASFPAAGLKGLFAFRKRLTDLPA